MSGAAEPGKPTLKRREFCHVCRQWRSRTSICCVKIDRKKEEIAFAPACRGCQKTIEASWRQPKPKAQAKRNRRAASPTGKGGDHG